MNNCLLCAERLIRRRANPFEFRHFESTLKTTKTNHKVIFMNRSKGGKVSVFFNANDALKQVLGKHAKSLSRSKQHQFIISPLIG